MSGVAFPGAPGPAQARADPQGLTCLVLIRHGETEWNSQGRIQGHIDTPLSERGRRQARDLERRLQGEAFAAVYASDLARARETAQPLALASGAELRLDERLRERRFGLFEGHTYAEAQSNWPTEYARWTLREPAHAVPGGESYLQARARVLEFLEEAVACHEGQGIAIVTHGGVLDIVYRRALGVAWEQPRAHRIPNACICRVWARLEAPGPGQAARLQLAVQSWGEVSHLDRTLDELA